jgi:type II secretory pathway component PulF
MPLFVSPRQFRQRAQFYVQLSQLTEAGLTMIRSLETIALKPPSDFFREPVLRALAELKQGATVADAWRKLGNWVPAFDIDLVQAAEHSGRLDHVFKMLSQHYQDEAALLSRIISGLMYPALLFHVAVVLFPFVEWFKGGMSVTGFFMSFLEILLPLYALIAFVLYAMQSTRTEKWRAFMERLLRPVPVLGTAMHCLALARLSASLEALINAGVGIIEAWEMAAATSGSPAMTRAVRKWKPQILEGLMPSEAVNANPGQFPEVFANLYQTGEVSGQLDDSLVRLRDYYREEATRRLELLAEWIPRIVYLLVALMVAVKIIIFFKSAVITPLQDIMKM